MKRRFKLLHVDTLTISAARDQWVAALATLRTEAMLAGRIEVRVWAWAVEPFESALKAARGDSMTIDLDPIFDPGTRFVTWTDDSLREFLRVTLCRRLTQDLAELADDQRGTPEDDDAATGAGAGRGIAARLEAIAAYRKTLDA